MKRRLLGTLQQTWQETTISAVVSRLQLHRPTWEADMVHSSRVRMWTESVSLIPLMRFQGFVDFQPRALAVCIGPKHGLGTDVFVGCWVVGPPGSNRRLTPASMSPAPSDFSSPDPLVATRNGPAPTRKNGATCLPDRVRNRRRVASDFSSAVVLNRFPIPIVSESSKPPFFCHSFSRALLRANSCVLQLRVFCFPGSALTPSGSLR